MKNKREKATENIKEEPAFAQAIVETIRQPLVVLNKDLQIVFANRFFYISFDVLPEETEGKVIYDLGNRQWNIPKLRELLEDILPERKQFQGFEVTHYFEKIGQRTMLLNAREMMQSDRDQRLVLLAIEDITHQKNEEIAFKKQEERKDFLLQLNDAVNSLSAPINLQATASQIVMDFLNTDRSCYGEVVNGKVLIRGDAYRKELSSIAGVYPIENSLFFRLAPNIDRPVVVENVHTTDWVNDELKQAYIDREMISFVIIPLLKKGHLTDIFCLSQKTSRKWSEDEVHLAIDAAERIRSALKNAKAEENLKTSEENYRVIVNQSVAGILKTDQQGKIIFNNEQLEDMLGYDNGELLQKNIADLVHKKDRARHHQMFEAMRKGGTGYMIEKRMLCKDGSFIWVHNYNSPIRKEDGSMKSATIISIDVSQQKNIEEQKDEFISIASHELKTPLTGIKAYAELLQEKFSEKGEINLINKLNSQVDRLNKLVYHLLDINRIADGRLVLQREVFDINELIKEHVSEIQLTAPDHEFKLELGKLSPIYADKEHIGQVLANLISNAAKYSPKSGLIIVASKEMDHEKVKVSVRDFGKGVKPDMQKKIFKRFYRSKHTAHTSGFGLGLYISKEIVEAHGGILDVESRPAYRSEKDTGSVFYFILPYKPNNEKST